jgi:magnesium chelatase family protein
MRTEVRGALADVLSSGCVAASGALARQRAVLIMVVVMCPCPCGYFGHTLRDCVCTPVEVGRYLAGYPDALRERVELHVELPPLLYREIMEKHRERSEAVAGRVQLARQRQRERWGDGLLRLNARVPWGEAEPHCRPSDTGAHLMKVAVERLGYVELSRTQVLRVARTIADLAGEDIISGIHVAEAIVSCARPSMRR